MSLTDKVRDHLLILRNLDASKYSITSDESLELRKVNKRTFFGHFVLWIIYKIFPCIPANPKLDRITRHILKEVGALRQVTYQDKILIDIAFKHLRTVIDLNGGSQGKSVTNLATKIGELPATQNLLPLEDVAKIEKSENNSPLPREIQNLIDGKESSNKHGIDDLIRFAEVLFSHSDRAKSDEGLTVIVQKIQKLSPILIYNHFSSNQDTYVKLYSRFNDQIRTHILAKVLRASLIEKMTYDNLFKVAKNESQEIWKNASRKAVAILNRDNEIITFDEFVKTDLIHLPTKFQSIILEHLFPESQDSIFNLFEYFIDEASLKDRKQFLENTNANFFQENHPDTNLAILVKSRELENPKYQSLLSNLFRDARFYPGQPAMAQFLSYFDEMNLEDLDCIVDLIQWLDKQNYKEFQEHLLAYVLEQKDNLISTDFHLNCFNNLNYFIVQKYVTSKLNDETSSSKFLQLAPLLKFDEAAFEIIVRNKSIRAWYESEKDQVVQYEKILPFITNTKFLSELFQPIFLAKDERYYDILFAHLEKQPWKAMLFISHNDTSEYIQHLRSWLRNQVDEEGHRRFPACIKIFTNTSEQEKVNYIKANLEISRFFKISYFGFFDINEKISTFMSFDQNIREHILFNTRNSSPEELRKDLLNMPPSQLGIALLDKISRKNIEESLEQESEVLDEITLKNINTLIELIESTFNDRLKI